MRQKKKKGNSTRALLGLEGFTNYGIQTAGGELAVFLVQPTNISVLSHANVEIKIRHLLMVFSAHPGLATRTLHFAKAITYCLRPSRAEPGGEI